MAQDVFSNTSVSVNSDSYKTGNFSVLSLYDQGVISLQQLNEFSKYKSFGILFCVVGILTSVLNVLSYSRCSHEAYFSYFTGVSVGDSLYLFSVCSSFMLSLVFPLYSQVCETYSFYVSTFANIVCRRSAIVINGIASSERFIKIIFPFKTKTNILSSYPRYVIVGVFILSFLVHLSLIMEFEVKEVKANVWAVVVSRSQVENPSLFVFLRHMSRVTFFYVPLTYLLAINAALVAALRTHAAKQLDIRATRGAKDTENPLDSRGKEVKRNEADQKELRPQDLRGRNIRSEAVMKTSRLVLIHTLTFFFLALPSAVNTTAISVVPDYGLFTVNRYLAYMLTYLTEWVVYLTQPFLFSVSLIFSRQFRKALFHRLPSCCSSFVSTPFSKDVYSKSDITQSVMS